jgi:hypothetical protein
MYDRNVWLIDMWGRSHRWQMENMPGTRQLLPNGRLL